MYIIPGILIVVALEGNDQKDHRGVVTGSSYSNYNNIDGIQKQNSNDGGRLVFAGGGRYRKLGASVCMY